MLKMADIEVIRKMHFMEGRSMRDIAERLGHSRKTIRKALASSDSPRYQLTKDKPAPIMGPVLPIIESWLKEDKTAPRKQQHTARRIYHRLVQEYGFAGSESTVRRMVRQIKESTPEPFVPLQVDLGEQAQVDWGQAQVMVGGQLVVAHLFCLRLRASGVSFAYAYPNERMEAFLDGHRRAFEWLGGVPRSCLYDNLKSAVLKILAGPERDEQKPFVAMRTHYLFESSFCRVRHGNEKGAVENLVGYVRRNTMVPVPQVGSFEELNARLLSWCKQDQQKRPQWEAEQASLRELPPVAHSCSRMVPVKVSPLCLVHFDRNRYSVPSSLVGKALFLRSFVDRVEVVDRERVVATHPRQYTRGETILALEHYLDAIAMKPRSATHAAAIRTLPAVFIRVRDHLLRSKKDGYRDFASILLLLREFPAKEVESALLAAEEKDMLREDVVRQLLVQARTTQVRATRAEVPAELQGHHIEREDPARYDQFLVGVTG